MKFKIKPEFSCPHCRENLLSNRNKLEVVLAIIYVASLPLIWVASEKIMIFFHLPADYLVWRLIGAAIGLLILLLVLFMLIKVE